MPTWGDSDKWTLTLTYFPSWDCSPKIYSWNVLEIVPDIVHHNDVIKIVWRRPLRSNALLVSVKIQQPFESANHMAAKLCQNICIWESLQSPALKYGSSRSCDLRSHPRSGQPGPCALRNHPLVWNDERLTQVREWQEYVDSKHESLWMLKNNMILYMHDM